MIDVLDDGQLLETAISTFMREMGASSCEPDQYASSVEQLEGHLYVVLRNHNALLQVYEVVGGGILRKLSKVPKSLRE